VPGGNGGERRRSAGEVGFIPHRFSKDLRGGGGDLMGFGLMREGGGMVQRLGFSWCTGGAQRTTAATGRMGGGGASDRRRKKGAGWTIGRSGRVGRMPIGPARRENKEKKVGWATENSFSNFESRI
jgi:hypothetical protein